MRQLHVFSFAAGVPPSVQSYWTVVEPAPPPRLSIALVGGTAASITWPVTYPGYLLEHAMRLPAVIWGTVTNDVTVLDGRFSVTVDRRESQRIYRLRKP